MKESLLDIDEIDAQIIQILQDNPNITHSKIAEQLDRSQPTIGLRIKKLEKKGFISHQFGMNLKKLKIFNVVKLQIRLKDPEHIDRLPKMCPFIINAFRQSGKYNVMMLIVSPSLKKIDSIIDHHFRNKGQVCDIEMELLTGYANDFIIPIDIRAFIEGKDEVMCSEDICPCMYHDVNFEQGERA